MLAVGAGVVSFLRACSTDQDRISAADKATPPDEKSFVQAVAEYGGSKYIYAKPLELLPLRRQRASALCTAVPRGIVSGWVGRVEEVSATNRGDAILRLYLYGGDTVFLENWNSKTSANEDKLPVPDGSETFNQISKLSQNELVTFSGSFQRSRSDCLRTSGSVTADETGNLAETMMSPTFIFSWADVRPLKH